MWLFELLTPLLGDWSVFHSHLADAVLTMLQVPLELEFGAYNRWLSLCS